MSGPITPLTPEQTVAAEAKARKHSYPVRLLIALDQLGAVLFGASNDTTISGDAAIADLDDTGAKRLYGRTMSSFLNLFQRDHGAKAVAGDLERAQAAAQDDAQSGVINKG